MFATLRNTMAEWYCASLENKLCKLHCTNFLNLAILGTKNPIKLSVIRTWLVR